MVKIKRYLDLTKKTSFLGEVRTIEEMDRILDQFESETGTHLTRSDFIRWAMSKFNEEKTFREEFFSQFRRDENVKEEPDKMHWSK